MSLVIDAVGRAATQAVTSVRALRLSASSSICGAVACEIARIVVTIDSCALGSPATYCSVYKPIARM